MERLSFPHPRPTSFRAIRCSRPTSRSWFAWLPPLPRKPVWPPWKCPWTLSWILLWASIGGLISYHYNIAQQAKPTPIPFVPLLEEATMAASIGVMVLASPLFHFILPTLPSKPGELPVLQNSEITPNRLWDKIGGQVAGCHGASWISPFRPPPSEEFYRINNMSSQYNIVHDELTRTMRRLWRDVYQPHCNLPPSAFLNVVGPVGQIHRALEEMNMAEWKNGEDKFQRRRIQIQYAFIGHIVHDMVLDMQKHIQPVRDVIKGLEESIDVLEECSQFMRDHLPSPEADSDVRLNGRIAQHTRYMIKAWTFGLKDLVAASAHITTLSLEMEKVINGQAYIGPPEDLELEVGRLHAELARGVMAHQKEMYEFNKKTKARESDDLTDETVEKGREAGLKVDAFGKPFLMPMWVWCRRHKYNCYTYWR